MLLLTTSALPEGLVVSQVFNMVMVTQPILISKKKLINKLFSFDKEVGLNDVMMMLEEEAPQGANAIIGIQVSTSTQYFENGSYMYVSMAGTPVMLSDSR